MGSKLIGTIARVLAGFILACLTAGLIKVLFVATPYKLATSTANVFAERAEETLMLSLRAATHSAIFASAFILIVAGVSEWLKIRTLPFYLLAGAGIALLGFTAQFASEAGGQPTIFNNYALKAFLTAGFFSGLMYWLVAGQFAGNASDAATGSSDKSKAAVKAKARPRIIVESAPVASAEKKAQSLAGRLAKDSPGPAVTPASPKKETPSAAAVATATTSVPATKPAATPDQAADKAKETLKKP